MKDSLEKDLVGCYAPDGRCRCNHSFGNPRYWNSEIFLAYHDTRWCKPKHDDHEIFAQLCLEFFAAGISFVMVLEKEQNLRAAFDDFAPEIVAGYDKAKMDALMQDAGIIRNRKKIEAAITNAKAFLRVQEEFGSFDKYIWDFANGQVIDHHLEDGSGMGLPDELSERISKDMKKRGIKFCGASTVYTFLEGIGIYNDHWEHCEFR